MISKEKEVCDRLAVFMGLLFTHLVLDIKETMVNFKPAELTYHVKKVFESASSTTDQTMMIGEHMD